MSSLYKRKVTHTIRQGLSEDKARSESPDSQEVGLQGPQW